MIIWGVVLAFFGLNTALIAWFILRFTVGPIWALIGFNAVLVGTCFVIASLFA